MEELAKIISIVSEYMDVCTSDIISGHDHKSCRARGVVCHTVRMGFPHLMKPLEEITSLTNSAIRKATAATDENINNDRVLRSLVNSIRRKLRLVALKKKTTDGVEIRLISATKTLFGFDYNDRDKLQFKKAAIRSMEYMKKLCAIGRQPIEEGMVYSITSPQIKRQWYNE